MKMNDKRYKAPATKKISHRTSRRKSLGSYKTSDLYLSAFLKSKGVILQSIDKKNGKVIFIFQDKGNILDLINKYFNDSDVNVLSFKAALRDLRSIIFDYQNSLKVKNSRNEK